jgi:hypothetical protein
MQGQLQINQMHARAICTEIGERLRPVLSKDGTSLPASLAKRLNRLREREADSPSIVPSLDRGLGS